MYFNNKGWIVKLPDWSNNPGHDLTDEEREILNDTWSSSDKLIEITADDFRKFIDKKIIEDIIEEVEKEKIKAYDKAMKGV